VGLSNLEIKFFKEHEHHRLVHVSKKHPFGEVTLIPMGNCICRFCLESRRGKDMPEMAPPRTLEPV
jgi:hypothetical protein